MTGTQTERIKSNLRSRLGITFALLIAGFAAFHAPAGEGVITAGTNAVAVLRTSAAVRGLSRDAAKQGVPVELRGVVTASWPGGAGDGFILNDGTADVFVFEGDTPTTEYEPGMRLEVIGLTDSGGYAPTVMPKNVRRLGRGELPLARPSTVAELLAGGRGTARDHLPSSSAATYSISSPAPSSRA